MLSVTDMQIEANKMFGRIKNLIKATAKFIWAFIRVIFTLIYRFIVVLAFIGLLILGLIKLIYLVNRDLIKGGYHISKTTAEFAKTKVVVPATDAYIAGSEKADKKSQDFQKVSFKNRGEALRHAWHDLKGGKINNAYSSLKKQLGFRRTKTSINVSEDK